MNKQLRKHLSGSMAFYSHIPCKLSDYEIVKDKSLYDQITTLHHLAHELNSVADRLGNQTVDNLIASESRDSWQLAENVPTNPFTFSYGFQDDRNTENIRRATIYAMEALSELPLSSRLFCNTHYIVCESSEYDKKYRGEYRTSPVWIGKQDCGISDASFVPPVGEDMTEALTDLENFIHYTDEDVFIKAAMIHYQFEMIHPFIDANGRVGRMLVMLFLYDNKVLHKPVLLLSDAIMPYVRKYYDTIQYVNMTRDIDTWIRFFLSVLESAFRQTIQKAIN